MKPLRYRAPLAPDDDDHRYAPWLRRLTQASGAYVIRSRRTGEVLYVGESHSGRLYATLTRHFQSWEDPMQFRATYGPSFVEVAVVTCGPACAERTQARLIRELKPRDNTQLVGETEEIDPRDFQD